MISNCDIYDDTQMNKLYEECELAERETEKEREELFTKCASVEALRPLVEEYYKLDMQATLYIKEIRTREADKKEAVLDLKNIYTYTMSLGEQMSDLIGRMQAALV